MPIKVTEIELTAGLKPIPLEQRYEEVCALVRLRGRPLGWALFAAQPPFVTVQQLREILTSQFSRHLLATAVTGEAEEPLVKELPISVVVCTRDRAEQLRGCLESLTAVNYENFEVVVVDNAPCNDSTERLASQFPVRYVCEMRPGLDYARNRGVQEARHAIVAFTDDDARVDREWLHTLARDFQDSTVSCVTGFVAPAELETEAQIDFELNYGGMAHGFKKRRVDGRTASTRELLWASNFGVGANMAFRKDVFERIGAFDVSLDVGTPSGGGGDVEMLHRVVAEGFTLLYDPAAIAWHTHRRDRFSLRRQLYQNGTGFGSYLLACARRGRVPKVAIANFALRHWFGGWIFRRLVKRGNLRRRYVLEELHGALRSPFAYYKSLRSTRRILDKAQTI